MRKEAPMPITNVRNNAVFVFVKIKGCTSCQKRKLAMIYTGQRGNIEVVSNGRFDVLRGDPIKFEKIGELKVPQLKWF
jgi:hypothetical protein